MSVADKQLLVSDFERLIADNFTASQISYIKNSLSEVLDKFNIIQYTQDMYTNRTPDDLLSAFITSKRIEGCSNKTLKHYEYCTLKMLKYLQIPIKSINVFHIRDFLSYEKNRGIADRTINGYRNVYSSFFTWLYKESLIPKNPCVNIGAIKCEKKIKKPFSDIEIEKLKECCGSDRNRAILFFLLSTGCRISEVYQLNKNDINLSTLECVVHGKGNKQRTVYISNVAAMMLERYFETRMNAGDTNDALFIGKGSKRLTPGGVRYMLKCVSKKANIPNVHPHRFRRTLATNLINRGMDIQDVAFILGHEKLDTTMKYVYISKQNVKNAYRKFAS